MLNIFFFPSHREQVDLSAVCVFSLSDISKVLDGPFKELKKSCDNWINHEPIPSPRPGQVLNCTFTVSMIYTAFLTLNNGWFTLNNLKSTSFLKFRKEETLCEFL